MVGLDYRVRPLSYVQLCTQSTVQGNEGESLSGFAFPILSVSEPVSVSVQSTAQCTVYSVQSMKRDWPESSGPLSVHGRECYSMYGVYRGWTSSKYKSTVVKRIEYREGMLLLQSGLISSVA